MRILFLAAPHAFEAFEENIEVVTEEFGVHPPLGMTVAAAAAREAGHEVQIIDGLGERLPSRDAVDRARAFGPDLIALRLHSTYRYWQDIEYLRPIRKADEASIHLDQRDPRVAELDVEPLALVGLSGRRELHGVRPVDPRGKRKQRLGDRRDELAVDRLRANGVQQDQVVPDQVVVEKRYVLDVGDLSPLARRPNEHLHVEPGEAHLCRDDLRP